MDRPGIKKPSLGSLRPARRSAESSAAELVRARLLSPDQPLPLVIEPAVDDLDPISWAGENLGFLETKLAQHGGILFRGFALADTGQFERFALSIVPRLVRYVEGSSPRLSLGGNLYTSTEYPPEYFISMHSELSYAHQWPSRIFFYCDVAPATGGETPVADNRKMLDLLPPDLVERFAERGVRYTRNLHGGLGAGLSWQTVFETEDRARVESYCREGEIDFRWKDDGGLWTSQKRPAVIRHPGTGERLWFNQADQWHPSNHDPATAAGLLATFGEAGLPIHATYADGSPIAIADLEEVRAAYRRVRIQFPWQKGDALLLDNMLVAHGRAPFAGPRRITVVMGEPVRLLEIERTV
jgi:alpha-ketoglutarate-dependent taurine dioxygenase